MYSAVLRKDLIPDDIQECDCKWKTGCAMLYPHPTMIIKSCENNACCSTGVECEHPKHPQKMYGRSTLEELFCPECSYVVSYAGRPDLGQPIWCKKCVENPPQSEEDSSE